MRRETGKVSAIDVAIGERIRQRRLELGLTQKKLAALLGLTAAQVQGFERGADRVAAAVLFEIARILEAPLQTFLPSEGRKNRSAFEHDAETRELVAEFERLKYQRSRRLVLTLAHELAEGEADCTKQHDDR
jgi:transcriptional regulator with XRE-family HTH domain